MYDIIKGPKINWIDIENPTKKDIDYLKKEFKFHPLILGELIRPSHRPKVEHYRNYLFMILYYPVYSKEKRETRPGELDIIITKNTLITSHYTPIAPLQNLFDRCKIRSEIKKRYMNRGSDYLLYLLLTAFWKSCLVKLARINNKIETIENKMFQGKEKEMVREISFIKTDIINFWRIVEPQKGILESLSIEGKNFFGEDFLPYSSDVLGIYESAWNLLKTSKETILALENTNQSLLSTKTNEIIRILTVFSVILLPLTLIASIWGMNLFLPLERSPNGFLIILVLMLFSVGFLILFFRKKKWL